MLSVWPGIKIWLFTILLNAFFWGIGGTYTDGPAGLLLAVIFLFGGYFITLPLLLLIVPIVKLSCRLPYSVAGKIAWLWFWLSMIIIGFSELLVWLFDGRFFSYNLFVVSLTGVAILALTLSIGISYQTLNKLNFKYNEKHLV